MCRAEAKNNPNLARREEKYMRRNAHQQGTQRLQQKELRITQKSGESSAITRALALIHMQLEPFLK
jgi:hypothetical protein